ncbi:MAG: hypothetical protein J0M12_11710 [Deltaproteobacteria bacterium]|nr:hypothetical protein [Deltaproteobacteria bacterium]
MTPNPATHSTGPGPGAESPAEIDLVFDFADTSHREPFAVANAIVEPHFSVVSRGGPTSSELCLHATIRFYVPGERRPIGSISLRADGLHDGVVNTMHGLVQPTLFGENVLDPDHAGIHHRFVAQLVETAEENGCIVESGWGSTAHAVSEGYRESIIRSMEKLPQARSIAVSKYNAEKRTFEKVEADGGPASDTFQWIDIDLSLEGELRGIDNLRRAVRGMDEKRLEALAPGLGKLAPDLGKAHILRLRLFTADADEPEATREKVYCIFLGNSFVTLRDGPSEILTRGILDLSVRRLLELEPSPAGLYTGLSEYCFERAESVVDQIDDRFLKKLVRSSKQHGKLHPSELQTLQEIKFTLEYIGGKFQDQADSLSGEKGPLAAMFKNGEASKHESLARALPNHVEDMRNFVRRIDRTIKLAEGLAQTSDSIAKTNTDVAIVVLAKFTLASAVGTVGAAAAIVEFLSEHVKEGFFYGGLAAAGLALVTPVAWVQKAVSAVSNRRR